MERLSLIFKFKFLIFNQCTMNKCNNDQKYNLEDRTLNFSKLLIRYIKTIRAITINENIIRQLLKSGTSVGANYREANGAESRRDFRHKISICKKEAKETQYWIALLFESNPEKEENGSHIYQESKELILIFSKIHKSSQ